MVRTAATAVVVASVLSLGTTGSALAQKSSPCAAKNPCAAKSANPCAAKNPCSAKNPCAAKNPCSAKNLCLPLIRRRSAHAATRRYS